MKAISDKEFGEIKLYKSAKARRISIKVGIDGQLRASLPPRTPAALVRKLINDSRVELRNIISSYHDSHSFTDGMQVGKSHTLIVRPAPSANLSVSIHGQQIITSLPDGKSISDHETQNIIRPVIIKILRKEARGYLPRRLEFLAEKHGFSYSRVRLSHASSRWGSCSLSGTISLNIALMKLPLPLIDYVLVHELCHTKELNHSKRFWSLVEKCSPDYSALRQEIKQYSPTI